MITDDLKHYIYKVNNFLSDEVCDQTVKEMDNVNFQEHQFYNSVKKQFHTRSGSQELSMSWDNVSTKPIIMEKLWHTLKSCLNYYDMHWFKEWAGYTNIRFNKYAENKKMALHCDHIKSMFDGERKGNPTLSMLGTLNDDYEGGEFIMFDNYEIKFKKGDLIIFPSNFLYPHKVEPVKKGTRYTYISWVW